MGDGTEVIKRREEDGCCNPYASLKSLDTSQKIDSSLENSCTVGPLILRPKKELGGKEQSLGKDWATESGTVGPSDLLGYNRPLSGCSKKLKNKKTSISCKHKKSKQSSSSRKITEKANGQKGAKAGNTEIS
ncbi:hypothetical protein Ancab_016821, partial [Ancistrocladus abbreviatus]